MYGFILILEMPRRTRDHLIYQRHFLFFRGQLLIAIKTEISDSIDTAPSEVEVEQTQTINEVMMMI